MPQQLFHPISISSPSSQHITRAVNSYMLQVRQSLAQIIVSLQSDQLLQQMRNDSTLYEQKLSYIQQLIHAQFKVQSINSKLIEQIQLMKDKNQELEIIIQQTESKVVQLQGKLQQSRDEYISQLNNIQTQYKQFLIEKQSSQQQMSKTLQHKQQTILNQQQQIQSLNTQLSKVKSTLQKQIQFLHEKLLMSNKTHEELNVRLKLYQQENRQLKEENYKMLNEQHRQDVERHNTMKERQQSDEKMKKMESRISGQQNQIMTLKQQLTNQQQHSDYLEQSLAQLHQLSEQYKSTIQEMKQHMFVIKQEWEKKCLSIQVNLSQQYHEKLIQHQQQMTSQLNSYIEEMKLGKAVVIQSSQDILESKRLLLERRYEQQLKVVESQYDQRANQYLQQTNLIKKQLEQKQKQLKSLQHKLKQSETQRKSAEQLSAKTQFELQQSIARLESTLSQTRLSFSTLEQQLTNKLTQLKQQSQKQVQRLRRTQVMLIKDIKTQKLQKQQINKQFTTIKDQFNTLKLNYIQQTQKLKQLQSVNSNQHSKILQLKKDLAIISQKSTLDQRSLKDKNQEIHRLENHINQLKIQSKDIDNVNRKLDVKLAQCILKIKENERMKSEMAHKVQKMYLLVRKLVKQLMIVKQDIQFQINSEKSRLQTITMQFSQELALREDSIKYSYKIRTQQLLEEVQNEKSQQRKQLEEIIRENTNMKKEIRLIEQVMREKDQDYIYQKERLVSLEVEKCRLLMQQDIDREKEEKKKLEERLYNQQKKHDYLMAKAQKQVSKTIKLFISKWEHKLTSTQETLEINENTAKQLTRQLKMTHTEINNLHNSIRERDEKLTKLQKKYQALKQQRDKTVDEMMRRLEKETKHKLSLQREMKEIRGEIMKTQPYMTTNNSPFNNYSFTDRENANVYTNAFQATTHEKATKTQIKASNREKELSQIREMIAKTYKVVEGPEKDSPLHKGKLF